MREQKSRYRPGLLSTLVIALASISALAASSGDAKPTPAAGIVVSACLDAINREAAPDPRSCPGFVVESLKSAAQICREASGKLVAGTEQAVWELDVNGDLKPEMTFAIDGNVSCEDALSIFSCGSLGCPTTLYQLQDGAWRAIGEIDTPTMQAVSVVDASPGHYGTLRVGCSSADCGETWTYLWTGSFYEKSYLEVRGFRINFADSIHGLHPLVAYTRLLTVPEPGASFVARYPAETEVAIIGTTEHGDYYYVSPCNACEGGFVEKSAVRP